MPGLTPTRTSTINDTLGDGVYKSRRVSTIGSSLGGPQSEVSDVTWDENDGQLPPDPTDLFLERIRGWRNLIHILVQQFQEQAHVEKGFLRSTEQSLKLWQGGSTLERDLAFGTDDNNMTQFMANMREYAHRLGNEHEAVYRSLVGQTIPTLQAIDHDASTKAHKLKVDRKAQMKQRIQDEKKLRVLIQNLQKSLASHKGTNGAYSVFQTGDPWLNNLLIRKHLYESIHRHQKSEQAQGNIDISFSIWEANVISNIKAALTHYTSLPGSTSTLESTGFLRDALTSLNAESTWSSFRDGRLAVSQSRDGPAAQYSGHDDEFVSLIKEGPIMRKSKLLKNWKESYWVITTSGWLHEFKNRPSLDGHAQVKPSKSIWLRSCTLTPLGGLTDGLPAEFHLVERADKATGISTKKGKTHKYMNDSVASSQIWWNVLSDFASGALGYANKYEYDERSQSRLQTSASRQTLSPVPQGMPQRAHSVASTASDYPSSLNEEIAGKDQDDVSETSSIAEHDISHAQSTGHVDRAHIINAEASQHSPAQFGSKIETKIETSIPAIVEPSVETSSRQQSEAKPVTTATPIKHDYSIPQNALDKLNLYRDESVAKHGSISNVAPAAEHGLTSQ